MLWILDALVLILWNNSVLFQSEIAKEIYQKVYDGCHFDECKNISYAMSIYIKFIPVLIYSTENCWHCLKW